jgi:hypothetical protein
VPHDGEAAVCYDLVCPPRSERSEAHGSYSITQSHGTISLVWTAIEFGDLHGTQSPIAVAGYLHCYSNLILVVVCLQPVPCYLKIFNGFCFTSKDQEACTFYSSPSYA